MKFRTETTIPAKATTLDWELCDCKVVAEFSTGAHQVDGVPARNDLVLLITPPETELGTIRIVMGPGEQTFDAVTAKLKEVMASNPRVTEKEIPAEEREIEVIEPGDVGDVEAVLGRR